MRTAFRRGLGPPRLRARLSAHVPALRRSRGERRPRGAGVVPRLALDAQNIDALAAQFFVFAPFGRFSDAMVRLRAAGMQFRVARFAARSDSPVAGWPRPTAIGPLQGEETL